MRKIVSATLIGVFLLMSPGCSKTTQQESAEGPRREDASYWLDKALAEVKQIDVSGDGDDAPLRAVLMACADLGEYDTYKSIVADLPEELGDTFYVLLVHDLMARGEVEQAVETAELAPTDEIRSSGRALIAVETSKNDLAEGLELARALADGNSRSIAFLHICELQAIAGDIEAAKASAAEVNGQFYSEVAFYVVVAGQVAGQYATGELDAPSHEDNTGNIYGGVVEMMLVKIVKGKADQGDFDRALELTEMMVFPDMRADAYLAIAEASLNAGLEDDCRRLMGLAETDLAASIEAGKSVMSNISSMKAMGLLYAKAGDIDSAIETMQRAGEEFAAWENDIKPALLKDPPFSGLEGDSALIEMLLGADRLDEARQFAETEDGSISETHRASFILALARTGRQDQAEKLAESAQTSAQRVTYYSALARGLAAREDGELNDSQ